MASTLLAFMYLILLFQSCGFAGSYSVKDVDVENADELVEKAASQSNAVSGRGKLALWYLLCFDLIFRILTIHLLPSHHFQAANDYPIVSKQKHLKNFKSRFHEFFTKLVHKIDGDLLTDDQFMGQLVRWLSSLSS